MAVSSFERKDYADLFYKVSESKDLRATVKHSLLGGLAVGAISAVGALLMGSKGLAIGGALGGIAMSTAMADKIVPVTTVLQSMSEQEWGKLCHTLKELTLKGSMDVGKNLVAGSSPMDLVPLAVTALSMFLSEEKNMQLEPVAGGGY